MMAAAYNSHVDVLQTLIETGANVEDRDGNGQTPLMIATRHNMLMIEQTLIETGANVRDKDNVGDTAIRLTAQFNAGANVQTAD